mgnify:FL=1|jgi:hypothetical protein
MLAAARPFVDGIDCRVETRSRSTLENVVFSFNGPLRDFTFNRWNPIGIVSGRQHLERIRYLIKKVTGLPNDAIVGIGAREGGTWRDSATEYVIRLISRIVYAGVSDPRVLLRRERILVRLTRRAERLFPVIQRSSVAG